MATALLASPGRTPLPGRQRWVVAQRSPRGGRPAVASSAAVGCRPAAVRRAGLPAGAAAGILGRVGPDRQRHLGHRGGRQPHLAALRGVSGRAVADLPIQVGGPTWGATCVWTSVYSSNKFLCRPGLPNQRPNSSVPRNLWSGCVPLPQPPVDARRWRAAGPQPTGGTQHTAADPPQR